MASGCICKEQEYFCIGCYSTYISRYGDEKHTCCCWGLGYDWSVLPLRSKPNHMTAGGGCFAGLACILFGDDTGKTYFHEHTKNICKTFSIYFPCGIYSSVDDAHMSEIELKTPCFGCKRYPEKQDLPQAISGAEKKTATVVPTNEIL